MTTTVEGKIIAESFANTRMMHDWLADETKLNGLKAKYPPEKYSAEMDLINRRIVVTAKDASC